MNLYRANFGDGTHTKGYPDIRDAKIAKWGRAGIVQYRTAIEVSTDGRDWRVLIQSRSAVNGPAVVAMER